MYKVILTGDADTGKSNLIHWLIKGRKRDVNYPTVGIEVGTRTYLADNTSVHIQFWDTAGQERFKSICLQHYKGAKAALLLFDITNPETFKELDRWITSIRENVENEDVVIVLVGNKVDKKNARRVSREEAQEFCSRNALTFYDEISAESGENVQQLMNTLLSRLLEQHPSISSTLLSRRSVPVPIQSRCCG